MDPSLGFADKAANAARVPPSSYSRPEEPPQGRNEDHERHPCFAVRLEQPNGNSASVMYGTLIGSPAFNPSDGISFVFEALFPKAGVWKEAKWLVSITGSNLRRIYEHLCLSKQRFIRKGVNLDEEADVLPLAEDAPEVTEISVNELPKKS